MAGMSKPCSPCQESFLEAAARTIVETVLGETRGARVTLEFWDDGCHGDGQHDYWIGPGRWGALEVTTLVDGPRANAQSMWEKFGPKPDDRVEGLAGSWSLLVDQNTKPRALMPHLRRWLPELERMGITSIPWSPDLSAPPPVLRLASAGVKMASRYAGRAGHVSIGRVNSIGPRPWGDPNHLVTAVNEALTLRRHRADADKLMRSQAHERHLFLRVSETTRLDVLLAIDEGMPTQPPNLPREITALWVAVPGKPVLHWAPPDGWRAHQL
jgi:hypothetical protein